MSTTRSLCSDAHNNVPIRKSQRLFFHHSTIGTIFLSGLCKHKESTTKHYPRLLNCKVGVRRVYKEAMNSQSYLLSSHQFPTATPVSNRNSNFLLIDSSLLVSSLQTDNKSSFSTHSTAMSFSMNTTPSVCVTDVNGLVLCVCCHGPLCVTTGVCIQSLSARKTRAVSSSMTSSSRSSSRSSSGGSSASTSCGQSEVGASIWTCCTCIFSNSTSLMGNTCVGCDHNRCKGCENGMPSVKLTKENKGKKTEQKKMSKAQMKGAKKQAL